MSKAKVTFLILSLLLIIAGGAIFGVCYARGARYDDNITYSTKTVELNEDFTIIDIDLYISNFELVKSDVNKVEFTETDKMHHEAKISEDKLSITFVDDTKWYEKFLVFGNKYNVKLFLTDETYEVFNYKNHTGTFKLSNAFTFTNFDLTSTTGSVKIAGLKGVNARVSSSTSRIELNNVALSNDLTVGNSTGAINLTNVTCKNLTVSNSTGGSTLTNVVASNNILVKSSTGSIHFDGIDASYIHAEASTGSIKGSVLSEKNFTASSSTGSVNVPTSVQNAGKCELKTSTGSITISIKEQ